MKIVLPTVMSLSGLLDDYGFRLTDYTSENEADEDNRKFFRPRQGRSSYWVKAPDGWSLEVDVRLSETRGLVVVLSPEYSLHRSATKGIIRVNITPLHGGIGFAGMFKGTNIVKGQKKYQRFMKELEDVFGIETYLDLKEDTNGNCHCLLYVSQRSELIVECSTDPSVVRLRLINGGGVIHDFTLHPNVEKIEAIDNRDDHNMVEIIDADIPSLERPNDDNSMLISPSRD